MILQRMEAEVDELGSFAGKKANRQWVWIARAATTRLILAFHVGDRSGQSANALGENPYRVAGPGYLLLGSVCGVQRRHLASATPFHPQASQQDK